MKKLTALSLLSVLAITGCACGAKQDTYTVDGFNDKTFKSYDEFKTYLINSGIISYKHTNNYWKINGLPSGISNEFGTEQEAINAYLNLFDPERYNADQVVFDSNGIATSIKMHVDTTTVYKMEDGTWTTDARAAYQSYVDTVSTGLWYSIEANGIRPLDSNNIDDLIAEFKRNINHQAATKIAAVDQTGVTEGDYITSGGVNYTWKNESYYSVHETVTPMPGAYLEYNGMPYEYKIEHSYNSAGSTPKILLNGGVMGSSIRQVMEDNEYIRIYSKDSTNRVQPFAGYVLKNTDYVDGIDYIWSLKHGKLIITSDKYFKEDGIDTTKYFDKDGNVTPDSDEWGALDCSKPIGHSKSMYACFNEFEINSKSGRAYAARKAETLNWTNFDPVKTARTIHFTNVDNHALDYSPAGRGSNKAGWYLRVDGINDIFDKMDCSEFYSHPVSGATLYYDVTNQNSNPYGQLTMSFANSLAKTETNPAAFYRPGFDFLTKGISGTDYILWNDANKYYPTTNALAGSRKLTNVESEAYTVTSEYWWIGTTTHVTYNSLADAEAAAEQIVRTLAIPEWRLFTMFGTGEVYTSKISLDDAFNNFMLLNSMTAKIVENEYLISTVRFENLPEYIVNNPTIVYKIPGYDKYFDSKVDAFNWYKANITNPISYVLATDTYSAKGISAATQEELAKKIWDTYSKKVQ